VAGTDESQPYTGWMLATKNEIEEAKLGNPKIKSESENEIER